MRLPRLPPARWNGSSSESHRTSFHAASASSSLASSSLALRCLREEPFLPCCFLSPLWLFDFLCAFFSFFLSLYSCGWGCKVSKWSCLTCGQLMAPHGWGDPAGRVWTRPPAL